MGRRPKQRKPEGQPATRNDPETPGQNTKPRTGKQPGAHRTPGPTFQCPPGDSFRVLRAMNPDTVVHFARFWVGRPLREKVTSRAQGEVFGFNSYPRSSGEWTLGCMNAATQNRTQRQRENRGIDVESIFSYAAFTKGSNMYIIGITAARYSTILPYVVKDQTTSSFDSLHLIVETT